MLSHAPPGRGPRPWRAPRSRAERLVVLAWAQLALVIAWLAHVALFAVFVLPGAGVMACFDGWEPTCGAPGPSTRFLLAFGLAWASVLGAAVATVAIAVRHRRGAASRAGVIASALLAFGAAWLAASAVGVLP